MTPGQRKRRDRNLALAAGRKAGLSLRALGVAVGLSAAQVAAILESLEREAAEKTERSQILASRCRHGR